MPVTVTFRCLQPWALPPHEYQVDRSVAQASSKVYRESFRHVRAERIPEHCAPWAMGQELGWRIPSPVDIDFSPLAQTEVAVESDPRAAAKASGRAELWQREGAALAVDRTPWLHLYQFRTENGFENMFLPNGAGSIEWHLGWAVDVPRGYFLLVAPLDQGGQLEIPTGILSSTVLGRMNRTSTGVGIAVRPTAPIHVRRGQDIARLILLHADSLQARTSYAPESTPAPDAAQDAVSTEGGM
ncbi:hypothetical protein [Streptomyces sp. NPDC002962]|uniref:hypothetical protein n=1 Tax=Streptomyces sp. NPDC002962 TaxID=3364674 RepID=UPI00368FE876